MNVRERMPHAPENAGLGLIEEGTAFAALTENKLVLSGTLPSSRISEYAFAFQRTAALRAAIELDVFTAIVDGHTTPAAPAQHCGAAERGIRILCDYLAALGLLTRKGEHYLPAQDAAAYLSRRSSLATLSASPHSLPH